MVADVRVISAVSLAQGSSEGIISNVNACFWPSAEVTVETRSTSVMVLQSCRSIESR